MDKNPTIGTAKNLGGKVEEGFGRVTGDAKTKAQGQMKQAEGSIQDLYGQAVDAAEVVVVCEVQRVVRGFGVSRRVR